MLLSGPVLRSAEQVGRHLLQMVHLAGPQMFAHLVLRLLGLVMGDGLENLQMAVMGADDSVGPVLRSGR